jgi:inhibitor of cysteine peptidase
MKTKLVLVCSVIVALVALGACTAALGQAAPEEMSVNESNAGKEVELATGGTLTITLESNPTTGFRWELARISEGDVMELTGNEFKGAENGLVGAGGKEVWTFKALAPGKSTITLEYSRPWAGGEKADQTFEVTVVVK